MSYEAILYGYRNEDSGKMYIGFHKTKEEYDNYIASTNCPEFQRDYENGLLNKHVLFRGDVSEAITLEHFVLTKFDARNNPNFYNRSVGGGVGCKKDFSNITKEMQQNVVDWVNGVTKKEQNKSKQLDFLDKELVLEISNNIKSKKYTSVEANVDEVYLLPKLQVREETLDQAHVQNIVNLFIDDPSAAKINVDPVVVVEFDNGSKMLVNGNHTITAAKKVGWNRINIIIIKFDLLNNKEYNLNYLGQCLNSEIKIRKPNTLDDLRRNILLAEQESVKIDPSCTVFSEKFKSMMVDAYSGLYTKKDISAAITRLKKIKEEERAKLLHNFNTFSKAEIESARKKLGKLFPDTATISIDSESLVNSGIGAVVNKMTSLGTKRGNILVSYRNFNSYSGRCDLIVRAQQNLEFLRNNADVSIYEIDPIIKKIKKVYAMC